MIYKIGQNKKKEKSPVCLSFKNIYKYISTHYETNQSVRECYFQKIGQVCAFKNIY